MRRHRWPVELFLGVCILGGLALLVTSVIEAAGGLRRYWIIGASVGGLVACGWLGWWTGSALGRKR